jgi:aspartyl-tRNA(Asn)/glutamyl-tRNA(Gln) amidotransferase subunit A
MIPSFESARAALAAGATTVEQITSGFLDAVRNGAPLNAFLQVFDERALARAREVDGRLARGTAGLLAGMVVAVKDNIAVRGARLTCASKMLEDYISPYDATVVRALEAQDVVLIGKTNLDEFGMGSSTENSAFGPVRHPHDASRVPGGSSGGSAVAVAAGMAHAALGSDTGGSVRHPASMCGVVGLKPTYGRVSRYGLVALSSSFDQIGVCTATVSDAASVLSVIAGHDPLDATSSPEPVQNYQTSLAGGVSGVKVGVLSESGGEAIQPEVREAVERAAGQIREAGGSVREIVLPHVRYSISAYYVLMTAEASSNLSRYDGARYGYRAEGAKDLEELYVRSRTEGFGREVKRRIMLGTYVLSAGYYDAYYRKAQKVRRLIQQDFLEAFRTVDCLLLPVAPTTAFAIGEKIEDPLQMYLSDVFTVSANLAGVPAISVPAGTDHKGMPIGVQLVGRPFGEETILRTGAFLERQSRQPAPDHHP